MVWLFDHTGKFPKSERFRLAKRIDDALFDFHKSLTAAVYRSDTRRHLQDADLHLNLLRAYLRLALELKYTAPKQYHYAAEQVNEIGKLLGGWIKKA